MGCDIHALIETRPSTPGASWRNVTPIDKDGYPVRHTSPCPDRVYGLFALLAGVRNEPENYVPPIAQPRGLPFDVSPEMVRLSEDHYGLDGHSHSYLTLAELLAYDYYQPIKRRRFVDLWSYFFWYDLRRAEGESPDASCGDVGGPGIQKISDAEAEALLKSKGNRDQTRQWVHEHGSKIYVDTIWTQPVIEYAGSVWIKTIPRMIAAQNAARLTVSDVRLVFFFDN